MTIRSRNNYDCASPKGFCGNTLFLDINNLHTCNWLSDVFYIFFMCAGEETPNLLQRFRQLHHVPQMWQKALNLFQSFCFRALSSISCMYVCMNVYILSKELCLSELVLVSEPHCTIMKIFYKCSKLPNNCCFLVVSMRMSSQNLLLLIIRDVASFLMF